MATSGKATRNVTKENIILISLLNQTAEPAEVRKIHMIRIPVLSKFLMRFRGRDSGIHEENINAKESRFRKEHIINDCEEVRDGDITTYLNSVAFAKVSTERNVRRELHRSGYFRRC